MSSQSPSTGVAVPGEGLDYDSPSKSVETKNRNVQRAEYIPKAQSPRTHLALKTQNIYPHTQVQHGNIKSGNASRISTPRSIHSPMNYPSLKNPHSFSQTRQRRSTLPCLVLTKRNSISPMSPVKSSNSPRSFEESRRRRSSGSICSNLSPSAKQRFHRVSQEAYQRRDCNGPLFQESSFQKISSPTPCTTHQELQDHDNGTTTTTRQNHENSEDDGKKNIVPKNSPKFSFGTIQLLCSVVARFKMNKLLRGQVTKLLRADEIRRIKNVFNRHQSAKGSGEIELWDLRKIMRELDIFVNEEDLLEFVRAELPSDRSSIDFQTLMRIILHQKKLDRPIHDDETLSAFVAMGGNADKSGEIMTEKLDEVCKEFGLTINISKLVEDIDEDGSGTVDFDEFSKLLHE